MNRTRVMACLVTGFLGLSLKATQPAEWHQEAGARWASLEIPRNGKAGFSQLAPERTGLFFTNALDDAASAANRVLENGGGVAVGDFDQDGRPDIFLCSLQGKNILYRNLGGWRFEEVTQPAGLSGTNEVARGAVFADLDGNGWPDLLISTLRHGVRCFLNLGNGTFRDATPDAGTETRHGSTTLALADIDGNGTLDLYVANYRAEDIRDLSRVEVQFVNGRMVLPPKYRDRLLLTPGGLMEWGEPDELYVNDGRGHFKSVSWTGGAFRDEAGQPLAKPPLDWGLTAAFRDLNGDGFPDLYVCNDYWTPDRIWINDGHGHFQAIAATAIRHTSENSMGVDFADIDRDGHVDFLVLDMLSPDPAERKRQALAQTRMAVTVGEIGNRPQIMRNTLFHNRGDGTFAELADYGGLPASGWSWQPVFLDVDLDGFEDLLISAGHRRDIQDLDATLRIQSLQHPWPKDMDPQARQAAFTRQMAEHARLYPTLPLPVVAFHNLGNLKFAEATQAWGTSAPGVHQGIALGDFDGDGDLDFVVNNLNGVCGVYRNEGSAPRVAVRLRGRSPNTPGIGARVKLLGGAVPTQSQEVVCGGRYLSGSEPLVVFAAGKAEGGMILEVRWRSGKSGVVSNVCPNRIYEIDETLARATPPAETRSEQPPPGVWFKDASTLIRHEHVENRFDDFARQPLLPRRFSQLGPGLGWFDIDGDGHEDLLVGTGAGGGLGVFHHDGHGGFQRETDLPVAAAVSRDQTAVLAMRNERGHTVVLCGSANYEDGLATGASVRQYDLGRKLLDESFPGSASSTGPLALADLDGDGELELFVGGRLVPGRYPEPADSRVYRRQAGAWELDKSNTEVVANAGLVSGAVWSDLDGDGYPELILACEWGPLRLFHNKAGRLREVTGEWGMSADTGWWSGVTTGDIDGDGRLDMIAANWGLNSPSQASQEHPLRLYYGDFNGQGAVDLIETEFDFRRQRDAPRLPLNRLAAGLPFLRERFATFKAFGEAGVEEVLGDRRDRASRVEVRTLASMVFFNRGPRFEPAALPPEAQWAPAFSVNVADFDGDGGEDIFLSQNFFALPSEAHRLDAGRGLWLRGDGRGALTAVPGQESGVKVYGEQRGAALADFNEDGRIDLAVSQNGAATQLYVNTGAKPGLRVRLAGPPGNPSGVGAVIRLQSGDRWGPAREIHAGSGYGSQDGAVQVMAYGSQPVKAHVRWPGGRTTATVVPANLAEVGIDREGRIQASR